MKAFQYRALVREIMARYAKRLDLIKVDACELADDVFFKRTTKEKLFSNLDKAVHEIH